MKPNMEHVLVIGGSGILRDLCRRLADDGKAVSVVARDKKRIVTMVADTQKSPGLVNPIEVDYTDIPAFEYKLTEAIAHLGPPAIIIDFINPKMEKARNSLFKFAIESCPESRFYDLLKVKLTGPENPFAERRARAQEAGIDYIGIMLGFSIKGEDVGPLSAEEIGAEVMTVLEMGEKEAVVGTVVRKMKGS